jgi:hypothetical protein
MKKTLLWILAFIITIGAAYYQRKTGPTYPKRVDAVFNGTSYELKLVRSLSLDERPEVKLNIMDTSIKALLWYKRLNTPDEYQSVPFRYKIYPVESFVMNRIFKITEEKGFFAEVPQQPPAGKLQYYLEITDAKETQIIMQETPAVIRFKGSVPGQVLLPHVILMFLAMLFSTGAGLMALFKVPSYKKFGIWTFILLLAGGMVLGPVVQKFAFGAFWTGIPFGWDITDNKTLIAFFFWMLAIIMNLRKERPVYTVLAAIVLLLVYSIPHSLFGSQLDYNTGEVTTGFIVAFFIGNKKNS